MEENYRTSLFKEEYLHIQSTIEDFDGRMLTIKAWSVSFSLAALGGAFAAHASEIFLIAALSALMFWLIEGFWKTFQVAYYDRSGKLEKYFSGSCTDLEPMQIGSAWFAHWRKGGVKKLLRIMLWPHVILPHGVVVVLGIVMYILSTIGWMQV